MEVKWHIEVVGKLHIRAVVNCQTKLAIDDLFNPEVLGILDAFLRIVAP